MSSDSSPWTACRTSAETSLPETGYESSAFSLSFFSLSSVSRSVSRGAVVAEVLTNDVSISQQRISSARQSTSIPRQAVIRGRSGETPLNTQEEVVSQGSQVSDCRRKTATPTMTAAVRKITKTARTFSQNWLIACFRSLARLRATVSTIARRRSIPANKASRAKPTLTPPPGKGCGNIHPQKSHSRTTTTEKMTPSKSRIGRVMGNRSTAPAIRKRTTIHAPDWLALRTNSDQMWMPQTKTWSQRARSPTSIGTNSRLALGES